MADVDRKTKIRAKVCTLGDSMKRTSLPTKTTILDEGDSGRSRIF